jgi:hypothetical protein
MSDTFPDVDPGADPDPHAFYTADGRRIVRTTEPPSFLFTPLPEASAPPLVSDDLLPLLPGEKALLRRIFEDEEP